MSGSTSSSPDIGKLLFSKGPKAADPKGPDIPQVPIERLVASPRRQVGRGRRDTVLTGEDGL